VTAESIFRTFPGTHRYKTSELLFDHAPNMTEMTVVLRLISHQANSMGCLQGASFSAEQLVILTYKANIKQNSTKLSVAISSSDI